MHVASSNAVPKISLVICTRNRAFTLSACLAAVDRLKADVSFEIVIVNNGSRDNTADVLAKFALNTQSNVVVINEPRAGLSQARNTGIQAARGEVIAFTDDDCYPGEDYINAIMLCFQDETIAYLGGRILLFDLADLPITIQPLDRAISLPAGCYLKPGLIHGANFAFRRRVFDLIGGFDIRLGAGTPLPSEDIDMLQRASLARLAGLYTPLVTVFHHHRRQTQQQAEEVMKSYALGRGAYFYKGLSRRESVGIFIWPVLRRLGGHIAFLRFAEFRHELQGALLYRRTSHSH